ncbi:MAG: type II secretion system protein [Desulfuromonadaceae bacterium]|nr:type II secretion system protein [Desulfuromonadaceae bacterium]
MFSTLRARKGLSLIELVVTITILGVLAAGVIPLTRMTAQRTKEIELRRNLRTIRSAIDEFKKKCDKVPANAPPPESCMPHSYPKTLEILLEGADFGDARTGKVKFLRRKIYDPFHPPESDNDDTWGWNLRSSVDKPDSTVWGNEDVFDVYSMSEGNAIDGKSKYNQW